MYKISVILFGIAVFVIPQCLVTAQEFPGGVFKTPYEYHFYDASASSNESTPFNGRFRFQVKAGSNAYISLTHRTEYNNTEFIIGHSNNMETLLIVNRTNYVRMFTPHILSPYEFQTFEIHWSRNIFHFAQIDESTNDTKNLMLFKSNKTVPINYIGLKADSEAQWFVRESDSPRIFDSYIKTVDKIDLQIGNSLRCMVIETKNHSEPIYVHTPSGSIQNKNYTYVGLPQQSCYNIYVRAKYDAHISLTNGWTNGTRNPIVEFHFRPGGAHNFTFEYNSNTIGNIFKRDLLNDHEYTGYWVNFDRNTGNLSIGTIGEDTFMSRNVEVFAINYIGFLTVGNVGDFIIKKHGNCPGNRDDDINTNYFWGDAKTRCYIENPLNATDIKN